MDDATFYAALAVFGTLALAMLFLIWHLAEQNAGRWAIIEALHAENEMLRLALDTLKAQPPRAEG